MGAHLLVKIKMGKGRLSFEPGTCRFLDGADVRNGFIRGVLSLAILAFWGGGRTCLAATPLFYQGRLQVVPGIGPVLRTEKKELTLAGKTTFLFHTLQDKRLASREVRLEGTLRPDGSFEVERIFTLRDGKLYRVRYYCEVCNIEALEPGNCVCCQQPTELQEIPVAAPGP